MKFKAITLNKWQQFENIEIIFGKRLTILTGANGSGKTTILNMLARHCDWNFQSLSTPEKDIATKTWNWICGLFRYNPESDNCVGELEYSNNAKSKIVVPQHESAQYQIQINNQQGIECFFIPSHRSVFRYQTLSNIPTQSTIDKRQAFTKVSNSNRNRYFGGNDQPSSFFMKETLVSWSIFGNGNKDMEPDDKLIEYFNGFENILKIVLPKDIGFSKFIVKNSEVVLECESENFIIDAASGGISAIIDMAWQIYMYSVDKNSEFTVLIDEVENHLHPTIQRSVLPNLIEAFSNVSFIISTHSPLIVGSVRDSEVYVLRFNKERKVVSQKIDLINKAKTASEILDEVLGVSFTMPIWAEDSLNNIVSKYINNNITEESFIKMREDLSNIGLEKFMPQAISNLLKEKNDQDK
ncbi:MAG: AAA family ATPase [Patescibacteria group bacterium]|jgi:hypothetical protein